IHRDLKPANVLVSEEGILKVIDFAVARTLDAEASVDLTRTGGVIGSLSYMSPEQARGSLDSVDHRTDVYAIGVVLFELIAGRCPHALEGRSWFESLRIVSTRPMPGLSLHAPRAARDLEAIVSLATAFEPSRRYASLAALAQDLRSFLRGETVMARLPTPAYLLRKGLKRHRVLVVSAAIILLLSLVAPVVSWNLYLRSEQRGELAERRARDLRRQVYLTHLAIAQQTILDGEIHVARTHLGSCPEELRHWEWRHLYRRCHRPARLLVAEKGRRSDLAFLSPSSVLASGAADAFTLWDLDAASPVRRYAGAKGFVDAFAVHDAARQIAAVDRSGFFCLWNFEGELLHTEPGSYLGAPAFGAEGRTCYLTDR
ncbi:MAG: protein kinase, partial [Planctomycetes bacterium]|nr:protein kinase [Planctomycetota bacterium]